MLQLAIWVLYPQVVMVAVDAAFFKVVVIIRLLIKRLLFQDLDEPHQLVHSS